jgi:hypothetical protein
MATIALQDGKVVLKDGKASCSCCDGCSCENISLSYPTSSPTTEKLTVSILGPALVTMIASNVDGSSLGWSMTTTATFTKNSGPDYSFPSTTVSTSYCIGCSPSEDKKTASIPEGVCGTLEFSFSLSGYDCCDSFEFSLECLFV